MPTVISGSTTLSALTTVSWGIMSLFLNNEPGGWYDPSDLTTLFQDAAGTTPVTAVEQPVGLVLDKSRGLVLGSELIANAADREFTSDTGYWTKEVGVTISGGKANWTNATQDYALVKSSFFSASRYYEVTFTISNYSSGGIKFFTNFSASSFTPAYTANGTYTVRFYYGAFYATTPFGFYASSTGTTLSVDDVSVRELPGSHLSQSTSTARPVLSARVNLLTYSEVFTDAAWTLSAVTPTIPGNITAPDGTSTGNILTETTTTAFHNVYRNTTITTSAAHTCNVYLKAGTRRYVTFGLEFSSNSAFMIIDTVNFSYTTKVTGTGSISDPSIVAVGNGWYRCSFNATNAGTYFQVCGSNSSNPSVINPSYLGDGSTIILWGADLRPANAGVGLPAYQRVGASTDYDATGFPLYLKFDGTDDFLVSGTISPGSVDKAQVFAGVRKLSDAGFGVVAETSTDPNTVNGTFSVGSSILRTDRQTWGAVTRGSSLCAGGARTYAAPDTRALTAIFDIAGTTAQTEVALRLNGVAQTLAYDGIDNAGTGNYTSQPLYVGARSGGVGLFSGNLYSLILRFSATNMDAATIASTETWVNSKTKAY